MGLLELFRKNGTLKKTSIRLFSFSTGISYAQNIDEAEKQALNPEFGGTQLTKESIDKLFAGRNSLVYTMSDGYISNWANKVKEPEENEDPNKLPTIGQYFIEKARGHTFFHLQFGEENKMSEDLSNAGLVVVYDKGEKTPEMLIDITQGPISNRQKKKFTGVT